MKIEIALPYIAEIEAAGFNLAADHPMYWIALAGYTYCKLYKACQDASGQIIMPAIGHLDEVATAMSTFSTEQQALINSIYPLYEPEEEP
jgi:hypothetical protein